jgi:pyruvate dehydrogenase (quinone)
VERTVGDYLLAYLEKIGINRLYGTSGPGLQGVLTAFARHPNPPTFISLQKEKDALRMAGAHARYTNQIGVCLVSADNNIVALLEGLVFASTQLRSVMILVGQTLRQINQDDTDLVDVLHMMTGTAPTVVSTPDMLGKQMQHVLQTTQQQTTIHSLIVPVHVQEQPMSFTSYTRSYQIAF